CRSIPLFRSTKGATLLHFFFTCTDEELSIGLSSHPTSSRHLVSCRSFASTSTSWRSLTRRTTAYSCTSPFSTRSYDYSHGAASRRESLLAGHRDGQPSNHHFVILLNQICMKMANDATLLHFFFTCTDEFMVFSLLIPLLYEMNDVGQLARDALLLILAVSAKQEEEYVAVKSAFCPVVATGLGGCFSQLSFILAG
ncbi:hypothetical protein PMAYCL1PPCAC_11028, partial [Pristionchus mayeri]